MAIDFQPTKKIDFTPTVSQPKNPLPLGTSTTTPIVDQLNKEPGLVQNVWQDLTERAKNIITDYSNLYKQAPELLEKPVKFAAKSLEMGIRVPGEVAGGVFDILGEGLKSAVKTIVNVIPESIKAPVIKGFAQGIQSASDALMQIPAYKVGIDAINQGVDKYDAWKKANPDLAKDMEALINIGMLIYANKPVQKKVKETTEFGKKQLSVVGEKTTETGETLIESGEKGIATEKQNFVRDLVSPEQTKSIKQEQVFRTTETGKGIFKKSIIEPTSADLRSEKEVLKIPGINSGQTAQQNFNVIQAENLKEAKTLESVLKSNDFTYNKSEFIARLKLVEADVASNPTIVGDSEKMAQKLIEEFKRRINIADDKGSTLLKIRKDYDSWVMSQKGANVFDPKIENPFTIVNRELRQTVNNFIDTKAADIGVKESLSKQSALFHAMDNIAPKAAVEADTAFGRLLQQTGEILGTKSRIVQGIAAAVGIGGLGAAATFAPPVAIAGGVGFLFYKAGKFILNPKLRVLMGKFLEEAGKAIMKVSDPLIKSQMIKDKKIVEQIYNSSKNSGLPPFTT